MGGMNPFESWFIVMLLGLAVIWLIVELARRARGPE